LYIPYVFTVPEVITLAIAMFPSLLGSKGFRGFPQFDGVADIEASMISNCYKYSPEINKNIYEKNKSTCQQKN
jgi:hypothetical protein